MVTIGKSQTQTKFMVVSLHIGFLCRFKQSAFLKVWENTLFLYSRIYKMVMLNVTSCISSGKMIDFGITQTGYQYYIVRSRIGQEHLNKSHTPVHSAQN